MHFQLAIFYCKIMKLLCKLEDDLKQNTEAPTLENPSTIWWAKSKDTICPPNIPVSLRNWLSQEKDWSKNKWDHVFIQSTSAVIHHSEDPWCLFPYQILGRSRLVDIKRNISPDFVMTKVPRSDYYKSVSSSEGMERFSLVFPFLITMP